jgi:predicted amidophosphoribosyltransferase
VGRLEDISELYGNFMLSPRSGPGVCEVCFNLTRGYERCYACTNEPQWLDVVAPISYSVAHEQLHHALAGYKRRTGGAAERFVVELSAVLWRHLVRHEACVARRAGVEEFALVTTVPSSDAQRDGAHPLRRIAGEIVAPTRRRYEPLLVRTDHPVSGRQFDRDKFDATRSLKGEDVLLVDDTWTTGANAQSAAWALKRAGAGAVAAVVIGRHLNRDWDRNDQRLRRLTRPFDWDVCAWCATEHLEPDDTDAASLAVRDPRGAAR